MSFKIRIFQPIVPAYRVPLFEGLAHAYPSRVEICAADMMSASDLSFDIKGVQTDYSHPMVRIGPFYWQKGLSLKGLGKDDVVVVNGDVRQLSTLWLIVKMRLKGMHYVWWGHHFSATSKMWRARIRLMLMRWLRPSAVLLYTRAGITWLREMGVVRNNVFATGNTIDVESVNEAMRFWVDEKLSCFKKKHKIFEKDVILCCSVMREKVRLDLLIKAMAMTELSDVNAVVIGDGQMKAIWQDEALRLGVADRIIWVDGTSDQMKLAPWFMCAKIFVYPGSIGLSILHSFAYGLPVVTHGNAAHQMPEFEAMVDGKTGVLFRENDSEDLAAKIRALLNSDHLNAMGDYARNVVENRYSMRKMVANFCEAVEAARNER